MVFFSEIMLETELVFLPEDNLTPFARFFNSPGEKIFSSRRSGLQCGETVLY